MKAKKKKEAHYSVIVISDRAEKEVSQKYMGKHDIQKTEKGLIIALVLCIVLCIGAIAGAMSFQGTLHIGATGVPEEQVAKLEAQRLELENQVAELTAALEEQQQAAEAAAAAELEKTIPKEFPLTGSATVEEGTMSVSLDGNVTEDRPIAIFTGTENTSVVASGDGVILSIADDATYGHVITIDHGNGYISLYYNSGEALVTQGQNVTKGTVLYQIGADNPTLGFQIIQAGVYIDPMSIVEIFG